MLSLLIFPPDIYVYFWTFYSIHLVCVPVRIWNCKQRNLLCQLEQKRNVLKSPGGLSREARESDLVTVQPGSWPPWRTVLGKTPLLLPPLGTNLKPSLMALGGRGGHQEPPPPTSPTHKPGVSTTSPINSDHMWHLLSYYPLLIQVSCGTTWLAESRSYAWVLAVGTFGSH